MYVYGIGCDLTGASLEHASLEKADLRGVYVTD